ncbi:MAG: glycosyltransferase family 39 protein [Candidatus Omnitrophota bacterium]|jgi:4-amino-4-deoxy-L-arabinose transferase-like glycosyltransferase|nr:glycosyltransferase family 39 protein [Candidatus Omnitrophota bacterium]
MQKKILIQILVLIGLAYVFLIMGNGVISLTNPDEVFYTQTTKEMIQQKTWMTPYLFGQPQFEKPIFLYWMLRASIEILGNTPFAARLPAAFIALLGIVAIYLLGLIGFKDSKKAFFSGLVMLSCGFYIGLSRSVFTDMIFSVFILFALLAFYWGYTYPVRKGIGLLLFAFFSALAVLTKGPLGCIITLAVVIAFLFVKKELKFLFCKYSLWGLLVFCVVALPWYILMEIKYGASFNREFFYNDHFVRLIKAEHPAADTWYFYPATLIGPIFPWSLYTLFALIYLVRGIRRNTDNFILFLGIWIGVILLVFQFAHSKLTSYIFPLFPALGLLTADFICNKGLSVKNPSRIFYTLSLITAIVILLFPVGLVAALSSYVMYVGSRAPVYALAITLFILGVFSLVFALRKRFTGLIFTLVFLPLVMLLGAASVIKDIEPYASSKPAVEYLMQNHTVSGQIICSKFFARGVRFYTDREVVVVDIPGTPFFSPHPVPFLDSDVKVREFLGKQPVTYGIIKKGNVVDFRRLTEGYFKFEILKQCGNEYVVRVLPLQ